MGSKGGTTQATNTNQTSTYTPTPQAQGYLTGAMDKATSAASNPFAIPQAPVAGFSQDQMGAFQQFRDAQGAAQPYYDQASNYFSPQGAQAFMNPYAANVMAGMKDVFGAQASQNTGNLVKSAGGVGADRIAVGQAELAKQQDLSAGQTLAGMYSQSVGQAQAAGQGQMALGANAQNSQLQGANAMLGVGGLQQQLSQAQMNSPYQQQLAMAAFPYQQAQFLAGITGALAPGFGGTTSGYGNSNGLTTPPPPSIYSQVLGAGTLAAGAYGAYGGSGSNAGSAGTLNYGDLGGGGFPEGVTNGSARGGRINPYGYAEGGDVEGGSSNPFHLPPGFNADPINVAQQSIIPQSQLAPIQSHIPQINLAPPPQAQQSGNQSNPMGDIAKIAQMAMMFANRGGRVDPYAVGGGVRRGSPKEFLDLTRGDPGWAHPDVGSGYAMPAAQPNSFEDRGAWNEMSPARSVPVKARGYADGGDTDVINPDEPYRLDPGAMEAWRKDTPVQSMALADDEPSSSTAFPYAPPRGRASTAAPVAATPAASADGMNPPSPYTVEPQEGMSRRDTGAAGSPWTALMSAGLGMMAGTSPYAGVNIGTGGQQGIKMLEAQRAAAQKDETTDLAARRLAQEAQHHNDQYTRMTPYQKGTLANQAAALDAEKYTNAGSIQTKDGLHPAVMEVKSGKIIDGITGKPPTPTDTVIQKGGSRNSPEEIGHVVDGIIDGSSPPTTTGLYGDATHVKAGLHAKGFNLAKAQQEWESAKKQTAAVNSSRMTMYVGLNKSVDRTIDEVKALADELQQGGVPLLNKLQLQSYINTQGNSEKGQLATRYMTAVNTLKEEFANLANGGYAPTEAAWKLANDQVNGNFGMKQMHASLSEIQRLIRYRINAIPNINAMGPGSANRYTGSSGQPPAAAATPPAGGAAAKPDVAKRFNDIIGGGKSEEEAYAILKEEGYR